MTVLDLASARGRRHPHGGDWSAFEYQGAARAWLEVLRAAASPPSRRPDLHHAASD